MRRYLRKLWNIGSLCVFFHGSFDTAYTDPVALIPADRHNEHGTVIVSWVHCFSKFQIFFKDILHLIREENGIRLVTFSLDVDAAFFEINVVQIQTDKL